MKLFKKVKRFWAMLMTHIFYGLGKSGNHSVIYKPLQINNPRGITLGDRVTVCEYGWLMGPLASNDFGLVIDDNTVIGHFSHIIANQRVYIGKSVLLADKVFVTDCTHKYDNIDRPIIEQDIEEISPVTIGDGSWLGENVCVCGANIGKHCVIGANSVVINDIPDYAIAIGCPAKVIKRYNFRKSAWEKIDNQNESNEK